jgi:hypothetical protein
VAIVLHPLEQGLDRLRAEVEPAAARRERVRLVDEEDAVEGAPDRAVGLDRGRADVLADELGAVDLDEVAFREQPHRAVHLGEEARDRRLARARVPEEDEVLRGRDLRQPVLEPLALHLEEGEERVDLLLHRVEPDERVELGLQLLERPGGLRPRELLVHPADRVDPRARGHALAEHAQPAGEVVEGIRGHRREATHLLMPIVSPVIR